tara:strand:- start:241 stop:405 length:165 start_codon:yes stop_codon:yes gene_type:complete
MYIIHSEPYLACEKMEYIVHHAGGKRKKFGGNCRKWGPMGYSFSVFVTGWVPGG